MISQDIQLLSDPQEGTDGVVWMDSDQLTKSIK